MKSLEEVIESVLSPNIDPKLDYTAEYEKWCKENRYANDVKSIIYNDKTGRFDIKFNDKEGSFRMFGDRIANVPWDKLPYGDVEGVFEMGYVTDANIENLPTSCGGFAAYGCIFTGSKPHTCKIIDYTPGSSRIYRGQIEIVKMRGSVTKLKNSGKLTFDVSGTKRIVGELKESKYGGVDTDKGCRIQPNAQKPADILKRVEIVGN